MAPDLSDEARLEYISNEINKILEMLDGAEDCKWIYQSLVQLSIAYKVSSGKWPQHADEIGQWMSELQKLDPLRKGKWIDISRTHGLYDLVT